MTRLLAIAMTLGLAACQPVAPPSRDRMPLEPALEACGATGLQSLVGQDKSVLAAMTLPVPTRVIPYGRPVTMDYSETRLNIVLGKEGRIARVFCG